MNKYAFDNLIGQNVNLYPQDTYKKSGILLEVNQYGYLFEITFAENGSGYKIGDVIFINHATKVVMSVYKPLN